MKINQLNEFAYDKESKVIGGVAGIDFIKQTLTILTDDDDLVVAKLSDVEILAKIGYIGEIGIINHDVLQTLDGKQYEIELQEDGVTLQMHLLNNKLERIEAGAFLKVSELNELKPYVELVGNIYELQFNVKTVDFNITIVRSFLGGEYRYHYACNNKDNEEVDLIKVVFIGSQLLEEEEYKRVLHTVLEEVIYLSDMVEKFLYLSRDTSNSNQIKRKTVDGVFLLQYVRNHLLPLIIKKQIKLNIQTLDPFTLYGDEDLLRRLFINLMENAIKYTPAGGIVEIKVCSKKEIIYIEIIDHGIGIPPEHLPFIFQRFYRVDDSRSRSQGGTGLGLSLCKWIVEAHKGTIEVHSEPDEGTRMIVGLAC